MVTAPSTAGSITNTATITSGVNDPVSGNNSASQGTTVNSAPGDDGELAYAQYGRPLHYEE
ncbi:MAG: hypothetical protein HZB32_03085 [Nitrospirae bacterium]|nr:hypothetical protein [Nitrospirota bacterium]